MRKLVVLFTLAACLTGAGCSRSADSPTSAEHAAIPAISVDELDHLLAHRDCVAVDANGDTTRKRMGIIPGAVLLRDLDSVDQLPADKAKNLVFYCANEACGASHEAANKAIVAGYSHVKVLPAGIAGWVKAGKQTSSM